MLEVRGLDVRYGEARAIRGVDLAVAEGEVVSIVGSNGAGKTTLVQAIAGMLPIVSGSVRIGGTDVAGAAGPHRLPIGRGDRARGPADLPGSHRERQPRPRRVPT